MEMRREARGSGGVMARWRAGEGYSLERLGVPGEADDPKS